MLATGAGTPTGPRQRVRQRILNSSAAPSMRYALIETCTIAAEREEGAVARTNLHAGSTGRAPFARRLELVLPSVDQSHCRQPECLDHLRALLTDLFFLARSQEREHAASRSSRLGLKLPEEILRQWRTQLERRPHGGRHDRCQESGRAPGP